MIVLGVDTSCDDTSCGIVDSDGKILANVVASQEIHGKFGGVVPEIASREHTRNIIPVVEKALTDANLSLDEIDGFGVTYAPGLVGALFVGLSFIKAISYATGKPFVGVNHLESHIFSILLEHRVKFPTLVLIVSGGHTELVLVRAPGSYKLLGSTLDDAAGEALDKVARVLGLKYPGGPKLEKLATDGDPQAVKLPRPEISGYNFSFSGLKTHAIQYFKHHPDIRREDFAASFQHAVMDALVTKLRKAVRELKIPRVGVVGGVAANEYLRNLIRDRLPTVELYLPSRKLCTDNGAMVAGVAQFRLNRGERSSLSLRPYSRLPKGGLE